MHVELPVLFFRPRGTAALWSCTPSCTLSTCGSAKALGAVLGFPVLFLTSTSCGFSFLAGPLFGLRPQGLPSIGLNSWFPPNPYRVFFFPFKDPFPTNFPCRRPSFPRLLLFYRLLGRLGRPIPFFPPHRDPIFPLPWSSPQDSRLAPRFSLWSMGPDRCNRRLFSRPDSPPTMVFKTRPSFSFPGRRRLSPCEHDFLFFWSFCCVLVDS